MKKLNYLILVNIFIWATFLSCSESSSDPKDTTAPKAVTLQLNATETVIGLSWNSPGDGDLNRFVILHSEDNVAFSKLDSTTKDVVEYNVEGLDYHKTYYYRVISYDNTGNKSEPSNTVFGELIDNKNPDKPSLSVVSTTDNSAKIKWAGVTDKDIKHWVLEEEVNGQGGFNVIEAALPAADSTYTKTGLNSTNIYAYRLKAVDLGDKEGAYSKTLRLTVGDSKASAWTNIKSGNYSLAIDFMDIALENGSLESNEAKAVRGWAYTYRADGVASSSDIQKALSDFSSSDTMDNVAGLTVAYSSQTNYYYAAQEAEKIHALSAYQHPELAGVNQRIIRLYGAYAYWNVINYEKTKAYLDAIEPQIDHSLDPMEQLADIQRLLSGESKVVGVNILNRIVNK